MEITESLPKGRDCDGSVVDACGCEGKLGHRPTEKFEFCEKIEVLCWTHFGISYLNPIDSIVGIASLKLSFETKSLKLNR